ncbi:hypothetical protein B0T22DRAFT_509279 [Podospora appendiculata]|uniref:RNase H type-1 domain-containing protein n=1 Tax=Podospora appendiculata TaxID=314037 RepID=A0AAE0XLR9_9PEZI|nr:hypothetical protein B0T22DRAFT_509279 [Podospora appendiculata]
MAIATAEYEEDRDWDQYGREQLVLFTDASRAKKHCHPENRGGYAVAWRRPGHRHLENCFRVRAIELTCITNTMHGEILGICEALCIAYEYALAGRLFKGTVQVFTDSMETIKILSVLRNTEALERVVDDPAAKPIVEAIIWLSHRLRGCRVHTDLHCIPGHGHNVYPHQLVDQTSRDIWTGEV